MHPVGCNRVVDTAAVPTRDRAVRPGGFRNRGENDARVSTWRANGGVSRGLRELLADRKTHRHGRVVAGQSDLLSIGVVAAVFVDRQRPVQPSDDDQTAHHNPADSDSCLRGDVLSCARVSVHSLSSKPFYVAHVSHHSVAERRDFCISLTGSTTESCSANQESGHNDISSLYYRDGSRCRFVLSAAEWFVVASTIQDRQIRAAL